MGSSSTELRYGARQSAPWDVCSCEEQSTRPAQPSALLICRISVVARRFLNRRRCALVATAFAAAILTNHATPGGARG